jgi:hypothetical protein
VLPRPSSARARAGGGAWRSAGPFLLMHAGMACVHGAGLWNAVPAVAAPVRALHSTRVPAVVQNTTPAVVPNWSLSAMPVLGTSTTAFKQHRPQWAGRRPRSELGRTGDFFTNPETWPFPPASPWRADKENACTPFSTLFF